MSDYYTDHLSAERLRRVYEIAPPRVRQYLEAEIDHVAGNIRPGDVVLELGCGYGRVVPRLAARAKAVIGIDTSLASLRMGQDLLRGIGNCHLACMNALHLGFADRTFDLVVCIQNGISAFHVDQRAVICEAVRVTRPAGLALFSSYSEKFWNDRLDWFERQSAAGLLGEIDHDKTRDGVIVCKDGFTATTVTPEYFRSLVDDLGAEVRIDEVDESSVFCAITIPHP
ncbi:MAG: class I SAM-dependent methyltransferase [Candidatus Zixiibacteriota bacterium]